MIGGEKNLKDSEGKSIKDTSSTLTSYQASGLGSGSVIWSYTKTNKLITALYIVTDIMDSNEPIRLKLRTLGVNILSDMSAQVGITSLTRLNLVKKIQEVVSFLDIASTIGLISLMNSNILKKEFLELNQSIKEQMKEYGDEPNISKPEWLEEFLKTPLPEETRPDVLGIASHTKSAFAIHKGHPIGHQIKDGNKRTNIGVQKGSTLLKALSDINNVRKENVNFELLKKQRREDIIRIIKIKSGSATITDIKEEAKGLPGPLASCGEKTLQRELLSMVKDGVLYKEGSKRWSRYKLVNVAG